ncbi:glycosyltransferase [Proteus mirabilis]|uniref:ATP-grasp fold amidoligase family protein n=1 Tax=Proteus mirabilis TaxID=584 RepID=UPI0018C831FC|nr:ATP-grasp fold amidoligase family protein [Proteus mirabilis]MBG3058776.1 glycosyltransferase [Proteus mirabilis]MCU9587200.1 glycosyltransferase [Proteus mirabilis]HCU0192420.1 glycosyltransferase [Proteus mirabilis]
MNSVKIKQYLKSLIPDIWYRKYIYKKTTGKKLNLNPPVTFNEKINYRILYDRKKIYTELADKITVRDYVKHKIGDKYLIKLIDIFDNTNSININKLPNKFVLKCNHDAGSVIICEDKTKFNFDNAFKRLEHALKHNMYSKTREWHYKNIKPKIICEEYIDIFSSEGEKYQPEDYKIHCFHGTPQILEIQFQRFNESRHINIYDTKWNLLPFLMGFPNTPYDVPKPINLDKLLILSTKLSKDFDYCRVDFYIAKGKIFFGEMTFTPCNGLDTFNPTEWDEKIGKLW